MWEVQMSIYGLRESPALWSGFRDHELRSAVWKATVDGENKNLKLQQLVSDNQVWKVVAEDNLEKALGYVMVYIDDLLITGPSEILHSFFGWVFRVRVMDANKVAIDGNLWLPGQEVRTIPRVQDFKIWFTTPVPATMMTVAIHFTFNLTLPRGEEGNTPLRVIEIEAPQGMELKVRRPADVRRLRRNDFVAVTEWNWTDIFPQQLWFGLDTDQNVSGTFHYAFPALTPTKMPVDNLWQVKLCTDSPFCTTNLLTIPIPGFFFGQDPDEPLSEEAQGMLQGDDGFRLVAAFLVTALAPHGSCPNCVYGGE
eukprot:s223_g1.t1